jgi:hypothetical protein
MKTALDMGLFFYIICTRRCAFIYGAKGAVVTAKTVGNML